MRAFIAIEISDAQKGILDRVEACLERAEADVKWVRPESIHMTLKFLGEITERQKEDIAAELDKIAKSFEPFDLTLKEVGAFPGMEHPRVIWVGIEKGSDQPAVLARQVETEMSKLGFAKEERVFSAHLTIGRVRSPRNVNKLRDKMPAAVSVISTSGETVHKVTSVVLFQSTLTPQGSTYSKLHESPFGG